jgi:hypothetical protein
MLLAEINSRFTPRLLYARMLSSKAILPLAQVLLLENAQLSLHSSLVWTGTIVHPKATIFAIAGPIVIGANCIIEEAAIIVNRCGCARMAM